MASGEYFFSSSWAVSKLPRDLDIFASLVMRKATWSQYLTKGLRPEADSCWAISASWWGNIKSCPPPWMSYWGPKYLSVIAVSSICQPGRPSPNGAGQDGSPACENFQRAKSPRLRFLLLSSIRETASSAISAVLPDSLP